jgi:hypothetical protein
VKGGAVKVLYKYGRTWRNIKDAGNEAESDQSKPRLGTCELLAWGSQAFTIWDAYDATLIRGDARTKRSDACFCDEGNRAVVSMLLSSK